MTGTGLDVARVEVVGAVFHPQPTVVPGEVRTNLCCRDAGDPCNSRSYVLQPATGNVKEEITGRPEVAYSGCNYTNSSKMSPRIIFLSLQVLHVVNTVLETTKIECSDRNQLDSLCNHCSKSDIRS